MRTQLHTVSSSTPQDFALRQQAEAQAAAMATPHASKPMPDTYTWQPQCLSNISWMITWRPRHTQPIRGRVWAMCAIRCHHWKARLVSKSQVCHWQHRHSRADCTHFARSMLEQQAVDATTGAGVLAATPVAVQATPAELRGHDAATSSTAAVCCAGSSSDSGDSEHDDEEDVSDGAATRSHDRRLEFTNYISEDAAHPVQPSCAQTVVGSDLHNGVLCACMLCGLMLWRLCIRAVALARFVELVYEFGR